MDIEVRNSEVKTVKVEHLVKVISRAKELNFEVFCDAADNKNLKFITIIMNSENEKAKVVYKLQQQERGVNGYKKYFGGMSNFKYDSQEKFIKNEWPCL